MLNTQYAGKNIKDKKDKKKDSKDKKKDSKDSKDIIKDSKDDIEKEPKKIGLTERDNPVRNIYDKIDNKVEPIKIIYQYRNNNK